VNGSLRAAITLAAGLAIAACSPSATAGPTAGGPAATTGAGSSTATPCAPATAAGTVKVAMKDFEYNPTSIAAKVGDTVTWTNAGPTNHTATVDSASSCDTGTIASGASGSITFSVAGTYQYHCTIHPSLMKGTVTVTG
jgi:plastocyanin